MSYCGKGPVPKGKTRGTAKECLRKNQVRFYGVEKIPEKYLLDPKKSLSINKEKIKLANLNTQGKKLVKDVKYYKYLIEREEKPVKASERKIYQKKVDALYKKRDKLVIKIKNQQKVIEALEKDKRRKKRRKEKKRKQMEE